jgi:four helix bundle protein
MEERYGLQAQIRRAAISIATNIVEGSSRLTEAEYCRFLEIAHGSARQACYLLSLCTELGFLAASATDPLAQGFDEVAGGLQKLGTTLRRA